VADRVDELAAGLRAFAQNESATVRAAVELLIWHERWLRRPDFGRAALTRRSEGQVWVSWRRAREFADSGPRSSTTELAILDLAVALGENRYRLTSMGHVHRRWIADAMALALGVAVGS